MTRTGRIVTTVGAALAGATVGYVAGLLSAPASGRDTRRVLRRRLEHEADDLAQKAESILRDAQHRVSGALRG